MHEMDSCFCVPAMCSQVTAQVDIDMRDDEMEGPRHRLWTHAAVGQSLPPLFTGHAISGKSLSPLSLGSTRT